MYIQKLITRYYFHQALLLQKYNETATMNYCTRLIILLLFFSTKISARPPSGNHYLAGGGISWHERDGFITFDSRHTEHYEKHTLLTVDVVYGRNVALPRGLRLTLPLRLAYGSVFEGTVDNVNILIGTNPVQEFDAVTLQLYSVVYHAGFEPMLQYPVRLTRDTWFYTATGGGFHYLGLIEQGRNRKLKVTMTDKNFAYLERSSGVSFSAAAGAGFERVLSPRFSYALQYTFRIWRPVHRMTARDIFPIEKLPYAEQFYSHAVTVTVLVAKRKR